MELDHIHPEPCPRCGSVLVFKDTVECPTTGSPVNFFRCDDCGYVHSVERVSAFPQALAAVNSFLAKDHKTLLLDVA